MRGQALSVTVFSQLSAIPMIALFLLVVPGRPGVSALLWGGLAGAAGFVGIVLLYRGLASGAMAVVAPTTAVTAAVVPLIGGLLFLGEKPGLFALLGAGCAVAAIALVTRSAPGAAHGVTVSVIAIALAAGALFGLFFLLLGQAGEGAGMWPLAAARCVGLPLGLLMLKPAGGTLRLTRHTALLAVLAGVLDISANGLYLLARYGGDVSIVAPVASLYPASTVLLALAINKERLLPAQMAGLGLAAAALVLAAS